MKDPEVINYINDAVRKSTDSSIQAITNLVNGVRNDVGSVKKDIDKIDSKIDSHKVVEAELRKEHREDMKREVTFAVREQVEITVNGKIVKVDNKIDSLRRENNEGMKRIEDKIDTKFVTQDQFSPYRKTLNIIGGAIILILVGAVFALIIKK